jgi:hypothetical protein
VGFGIAPTSVAKTGVSSASCFEPLFNVYYSSRASNREFVLGKIKGTNEGDGVVTDIAATATSPTKIASSLTLIDASATTGGVEILAGATNRSSAGHFENGASLNANITITYTGLTIKGGSGGDFIENDAKNGIVTDGNHNDDFVALGGAGAKATLGTGADDFVAVGVATWGPMRQPETPSAIV